MRTGRANVGLVEDIKVEVYGQMMPLKSNVSITIPDAKTIQIEPWDKAITKDIEKALVDADLGMMPNMQGSIIRLALPPMTEENRKQMVKVLHKKEELARIQLRTVRDKVKGAVLKDEKEKLISEDERHRLLEQLDKEVATWNTKLGDMAKDKEEEIMKV